MTESVTKWARLGLAATGAVATTLVPTMVAMTGWTVYEARGPIKAGLERGWDWYRQRGQTVKGEEQSDEEESTPPTTEVMLLSKL
ncbi:hypothetical protein pipiens_018022 [Culex pipiens pipiens]|uniref:Uncharacterized protein n=1 Tax=Culex pipiens pipiens TaxID=38569 RepID=A0ABD1CDR6_CULPP